MVVSPDGEGETAFDLGVACLQVWITQCTARKHCLLCLVEGDCTKLLPVTDELVLDYNLVDRKLALGTLLFTTLQAGRFLILTSRSDSIGT